MKRSRFSDQQIAFALQQAEQGTADLSLDKEMLQEVIRKKL